MRSDKTDAVKCAKEGAMKDRWDKAQSLATIVSLLAVPTVLAWGGWRIQERIAEQSTKREYVQLAVSILKEPPSRESNDEQDLRAWAVSLLEQNSPLPFSKQSRAALLTSRLPARDASMDATWEEARKYMPTKCAGALIYGGQAGYDECMSYTADFDCKLKEYVERERKNREEPKPAPAPEKGQRR
jgi:hypothetical protein